MVTKDNTPEKTEAPQGEHPEKGTVQEEPRVEFRKKAPDIEKYRKMVAEEEGVDPSQIDDEGNVNIRAMATKGAEEEKTQEKEGETEETKQEIPDRYKGKTPEELIKILEDKENYIQSRSGKIGELQKQADIAAELQKKIEAIESQTLRETQKGPGLPQPPEAPDITEDEYFDDPLKALNKYKEYNKKVVEWNRQYIHAAVNPYYEERAKTGKKELYDQLEEKYKDYPVKYDRTKVQEFLDKNPDYFTKYKINAYEQAYHDMNTAEFSQLSKKQQDEMREQVKKELLEEMNNQKQAGNIGMTDLQTQDLSGSSPEYDEKRFEEDTEYRRKVMADIEKRKK
jgi:hypothetical protein